MFNKNHYAVLGLKSFESDENKIKKAYMSIARKHHPDKNPDNPDAREKFEEADSAYKLLTNSDKKAEKEEFDKQLREHPELFEKSEDIVFVYQAEPNAAQFAISASSSAGMASYQAPEQSAQRRINISNLIDNAQISPEKLIELALQNQQFCQLLLSNARVMAYFNDTQLVQFVLQYYQLVKDSPEQFKQVPGVNALLSKLEKYAGCFLIAHTDFAEVVIDFIKQFKNEFEKLSSYQLIALMDIYPEFYDVLIQQHVGQLSVVELEYAIVKLPENDSRREQLITAYKTANENIRSEFELCEQIKLLNGNSESWDEDKTIELIREIGAIKYLSLSPMIKGFHWIAWDSLFFLAFDDDAIIAAAKGEDFDSILHRVLARLGQGNEPRLEKLLQELIDENQNKQQEVLDELVEKNIILLNLSSDLRLTLIRLLLNSDVFFARVNRQDKGYVGFFKKNRLLDELCKNEEFQSRAVKVSHTVLTKFLERPKQNCLSKEKHPDVGNVAAYKALNSISEQAREAVEAFEEFSLYVLINPQVDGKPLPKLSLEKFKELIEKTGFFAELKNLMWVEGNVKIELLRLVVSNQQQKEKTEGKTTEEGAEFVRSVNKVDDLMTFGLSFGGFFKMHGQRKNKFTAALTRLTFDFAPFFKKKEMLLWDLEDASKYSPLLLCMLEEFSQYFSQKITGRYLAEMAGKFSEEVTSHHLIKEKIQAYQKLSLLIGQLQQDDLVDVDQLIEQISITLLDKEIALSLEQAYQQHAVSVAKIVQYFLQSPQLIADVDAQKILQTLQGEIAKDSASGKLLFADIEYTKTYLASNGSAVGGDMVMRLKSDFGHAILPTLETYGLLERLQQFSALDELFEQLPQGSFSQMVVEDDAEKEFQRCCDVITALLDDSGVDLAKVAGVDEVYQDFLQIPKSVKKPTTAFITGFPQADPQNLLLWMLNVAKQDVQFATNFLFQALRKNRCSIDLTSEDFEFFLKQIFTEFYSMQPDDVLMICQLAPSVAKKIFIDVSKNNPQSKQDIAFLAKLLPESAFAYLVQNEKANPVTWKLIKENRITYNEIVLLNSEAISFFNLLEQPGSGAAYLLQNTDAAVDNVYALVNSNQQLNRLFIAQLVVEMMKAESISLLGVESIKVGENSDANPALSLLLEAGWFDQELIEFFKLSLPQVHTNFKEKIETDAPENIRNVFLLSAFLSQQFFIYFDEAVLMPLRDTSTAKKYSTEDRKQFDVVYQKIEQCILDSVKNHSVNSAENQNKTAEMLLLELNAAVQQGAQQILAEKTADRQASGAVKNLCRTLSNEKSAARKLHPRKTTRKYLVEKLEGYTPASRSGVRAGDEKQHALTNLKDKFSGAERGASVSALCSFWAEETSSDGEMTNSEVIVQVRNVFHSEGSKRVGGKMTNTEAFVNALNKQNMKIQF